MAITQLAPSGGPGRRYGSFAGKTAGSSAGPHPVGLLTQLGPGAWPGRRYGGFVGRVPVEPEPTPTTEETPVFSTPSGAYRRRPTNRYWLDLLDEEEIVLILAALERNNLL